MTVLPFTGSGGSLLTVWDLGYLLRWKIIFFYLLSGWILGYLLMYCETGKGSTCFLSTPYSLSFFAYYRTTCAGVHAACGFSGSFDAHPSAKPTKAQEVLCTSVKQFVAHRRKSQVHKVSEKTLIISTTFTKFHSNLHTVNYPSLKNSIGLLFMYTEILICPWWMD